MIEARIPWTLEGPDDEITFDPRDPTTPFMLTSKPKTTVDDRRDVYDYPLDDGSHVGDAYAGHRIWTFNGKIRESSHAARNVALQRLTALLNSLRREDGLLKWQPSGFPAVQSTVRRLGSVDPTGGAGFMQPFQFGLIAGDPRVYSQAETIDSVGAGSATIGANLMSANQASIETDATDWTAASTWTVSRDTAQAHEGSASLRVVYASGGSISAVTATSTAVSVGANDIVRIAAWIRSDLAASARISIAPYKADDTSAGSALATEYVALTADTWTEISSDDLTLPADTSYVKVTVLSYDTTGTFYTSTRGIYIDDVSVDPVTYSADLAITNAGDAWTRPVYTVTGPVTNPKIINSGRNERLTLDATIAAATTLTVDVAEREIYTGASLTDASNMYSSKPATSPFPRVYPGANTIVFQGGGTDANSEMEVRWRDAWMP